MTISGTIDEVQSLFKEYSDLLKHTISVPDSVSVNLSLYAQNRQLLVLDRRSLLEVSASSLGPTHTPEDICIIEKEIFDRLCQDNPMYTVHSSASSVKNRSDVTGTNNPIVKSNNSPVVYNGETTQPITDCNFAQTAQEKPKTKSADSKTTVVSSPVTLIAEEYDHLMSLNEDYRIEDLKEDSFKREEHCAFGIKRLDENYFCLYYRKSIYDKGSDTTFRHYLLKQPGELVAYMYFKELGSLRYLFETIERKLRHNGSNILSRPQADQIVHYYSYCF